MAVTGGTTIHGIPKFADSDSPDLNGNLGGILDILDGLIGAYKLPDLTLSAPSAAITISSIPLTGKYLRLVVEARSANAAALDTLQIRFNNDGTANYVYEEYTAAAAALAASEGLPGPLSGFVGRIPGAGAGSAAYSGVCVIDLPTYSSSAFRKRWISQWSTNNDATTGTIRTGQTGGYWNQSNQIVTVTLFAASGNLITNCSVAAYLMP